MFDINIMPQYLKIIGIVPFFKNIIKTYIGRVFRLELDHKRECQPTALIIPKLIFNINIHLIGNKDVISATVESKTRHAA